MSLPISIKKKLSANQDTLNQVAGITGLGWTTSLLGYLFVVIGYSNTFVTNSQSLLSLGCVCFVATFGLDRLVDTL